MMEPNTATPRPSAVATLPGHSLLASIKPQPVRLETEYGCVDWFPYDNARQSRTDWFDYDNGLAVAGVA
jgi:hypothetical protein